MFTIKNFWMWLILMVVLAAGYATRVQSQDMLVEDLLSYQGKQKPSTNINKLFSELGVVPPAHGRPDPCFDVEGYTLKFCTLHGVQVLLSSNKVSGMDVEILTKLSQHLDSCQQIALYIGRVCKQENFIRIVNHFALKK